MTKSRRVLYHTLVGLFALGMTYPILWLVASSLKPNHEIFTTAYSLIPSRLEFSNYATGWKGFAGTTFGTFFKILLSLSSSPPLGPSPPRRLSPSDWLGPSSSDSSSGSPA